MHGKKKYDQRVVGEQGGGEKEAGATEEREGGVGGQAGREGRDARGRAQSVSLKPRNHSGDTSRKNVSARRDADRHYRVLATRSETVNGLPSSLGTNHTLGDTVYR